MSVKTFNPDLWLSELPTGQTGSLNERSCAVKWFHIAVGDVDTVQMADNLRKLVMTKLFCELAKRLPSPESPFRIGDMEAYTTEGGTDCITGIFRYQPATSDLPQSRKGKV